MENKAYNFKKLGVMIDCSRNAVMTVEELKKFITVLGKMGYNQVQLYMEDTYEVDGYDKFGYLRGKYSKNELKDLDDFAFNLGIELVPNIQTLAHMTAYSRWCPEIIDLDDVMLVDDDRVYEFIDAMMKSIRVCFRTDNIHIGMDEAFGLGRGKHLDKYGQQNRFDIILRHLNKVCKICEKYNLKPMMWSDMFYRIANGGEYYESKSKFDDSISALIPENLTLVYWDYYSTDRKRYDSMIKGHRQLSDKIIFAGGARKWDGFATRNDFSIKATKAAFKACADNRLDEVFITMWGDNGAETSSWAVLPTLCYAACLNKGITSISEIKEKFKEWVGARYEDFMLLDIPDSLDNNRGIINPSKIFLYADCFMSIFQNIEKPEYKNQYISFARKLKYAAKRSGEYSYLFDTLSTLCDVLAIKVDLCTRTREAYNSKDNEKLDLIIADYRKLIKRLEVFYYTFRNQWFKENKPHGFDVQDIRIGGLQRRVKACCERLIDLRNGKISSIPELEENISPMVNELPLFNCWNKTCSNNLI